MPEGDPSNQYTRSVDIFAYGLLMLELVTGRKVGPGGTSGREELPGLQRVSVWVWVASVCAGRAGRLVCSRGAIASPVAAEAGWHSLASAATLPFPLTRCHRWTAPASRTGRSG